MANRRDPEQRSATSAPQPGQAPAQPTGDEVFRPQATQGGRPDEAEPTEEELKELDELREAVESAYARLSEATADLTERVSEFYDAGCAFVRDNPTSTVVGAFALGILIGIFSSDD